MMVALARDGYAGASVSSVIELAGVSRATFYEHFCNREDCFLTAQEASAERALRCIGADASSRPSLPAALEDVLVRAAENPAATRLLLVETPGATRAARHQFDRFLARVAAVIDASLAGRFAVQLPASSLLDGVAGVIATRLLSGRGDHLPALAGDLLAWGASYVEADGERCLSEEEWSALGRSLTPAEPGAEPDFSLLPRGRSALDAAAAGASRRRRIVLATAQVAAEKGFAELTVADIVAAARVPRSAFYAQFSGKEGVFLAVQEEILRGAMAAAASRFAIGASWPERVWNGLAGLLYYVAERPDLARAGIVEAQSAGTRAILRSHENCLAFTLFLEEGIRRSGRLAGDPRVCSEAIAFAIHGLMRRGLTRAGAGGMPDLLPQCTQIALAPFIGPGPAREFVLRKVREVG
jgi:AcrR family transcriptional regulator